MKNIYLSSLIGDKPLMVSPSGLLDFSPDDAIGWQVWQGSEQDATMIANKYKDHPIYIAEEIN